MNKIQLICRFLPAYYEELFCKILYIFEQYAMNEFGEQGLTIGYLTEKCKIGKINDIILVIHFCIECQFISGPDPIFTSNPLENEYFWIGK